MTTHKTLTIQKSEATVSAPMKSTVAEFDRFADLAKKLVGVPKRELDEARERERLAKG
ncbi:MAG: hypothetical protein KF703_00605 [Actinobacteria bacterium]|nr:hypothetical protein [Actinomycetota bacterium]